MHDHYINVHTQERYDRMLTRLDRIPEELWAFDIETDRLDPRTLDAERGPGKMVSLSLTDDCEQTWVLPLWHPEGPWQAQWKQRLRQVIDVLAARRARLVAHNANFDLGWVHATTEVDMSDLLYWDTQTVAHLLNENQSKRLKSLAAHLIGGNWGIDVRRAWEVPWFDLAPYNAWDTIATMRLYQIQRADLSSVSDLWDLHEEIVRPAQRTLLRMSQRGIGYDRVQAVKERREARLQQESAEHVLEHMAMSWYGLDLDSYPTRSWASTSKMFTDFVSSAVEAGDLYVRETTPKGNPSWRSGVLSDIVREEEGEPRIIARSLLDQRDGMKRLQFLSSWNDASRWDGRIHANFNNSRVVTGRLSSSDPNMQQVARTLKHLFIPDEGWEFCEIDWSQIELRVIAEMIHRWVEPGNPMMQAFRSGADLHSIAATLVTGGKVSQVTKPQRQKGKAINFGFCFGMGAENFVQYARETYGVDFTLSEAKRVRDGFFSTWSGLADWHALMCERAMEDGYVTNLYGRRRRLPEVFSSDQYLRSAALRQAINSPVQGTASDLMMSVLPKVEQCYGVSLVGTVHDSVLMEIQSEDAAESAACAMLTGAVGYEVPLEVEVGIGPRWTENRTVFTRST